MESLIEIDCRCLWPPFTQVQTARPRIPIVRAQGVYLFSEEGRRYLDGISSWWVNLHGHAHPYIIDKIHSQAQKLEHVIFADFTHAPAVELGSRLLSLLPGGMSKVFYSDNGSTAVEVALKMAIQYWHLQDPGTKRTQVVCFRKGYHGDTFGAMSAAGKNAFNRPFWKHLFDTVEIDPPVAGQEEKSLSQLQKILHKGTVACFIFEPLILGAGGMITYSAEGLGCMIQCCRDHHVLTIADEVMTGFGRTGTLFACEQLSGQPDFLCLSKGLTGGFLPLGVTACTEEVFRAFLSEHLHDAFLHGHSYTANPLACSSALASLDLLQQESCRMQREMIASCHRDFCRTWQGHPQLKRCESLGTILVLEYQSDSSSYFQPLRNRLYDFFLHEGILLRPLGNVLYVLPPYCIQHEELHTVYSLIVRTLEEERWHH